MTDLSSIAAREAAATPGRLDAIRSFVESFKALDHGTTDHAIGHLEWLLGEASRLTAALATAQELNEAHRALAEAQSGHIETVNAAFERQYAQGFEAGKEAAAKVCEDLREDGSEDFRSAIHRIRALKRGDQ